MRNLKLCKQQFQNVNTYNTLPAFLDHVIVKFISTRAFSLRRVKIYNLHSFVVFVIVPKSLIKYLYCSIKMSLFSYMYHELK